MNDTEWTYKYIEDGKALEIYKDGKRNHLVTIEHLAHLFLAVDNGFENGLFEDTTFESDGDILNHYIIRLRESNGGFVKR